MENQTSKVQEAYTPCEVASPPITVPLSPLSAFAAFFKEAITARRPGPLLAKAIAACGAKVAILDLRKEAADKVADEIVAAGGVAIGVAANVLEKVSLEAAHKDVNTRLGSCDILINGAGGNQ